MLAVLQWLYANVTGNLVASAICFIAAWFWKIRPHLRRQRLHREDMAVQIADLHAKHDALHEKIRSRREP